MFVFKHAVALLIALCVVSCRAMSLEQIISNLTQKETDELKQFGIRKHEKTGSYSLSDFDRIPLTIVAFTNQNQWNIRLVNPVFFINLHKFSPKIQYLAREICRNFVFNGMDGLEDNAKSFMIDDFKKKFDFCAPAADQFLLLDSSHMSSWSSSESVLVGATMIMFFGSFYSLLMQDRKSFEFTVEGALFFTSITYVYGFFAGK